MLQTASTLSTCCPPAAPASAASELEAAASLSMTIVSFSGFEVEMVMGLLPDVVVVVVDVVLVGRLEVGVGVLGLDVVLVGRLEVGVGVLGLVMEA